MPGLRSSAKQYHEHCEKHRLWMIGALARVLAGLAHYQLNELSAAEDFLSSSETERLRMDYRSATWCRGYLVLTFAAANRWDDAENLVESLLDELRTRPNPLVSPFVEGLGAELALRQGRISRAIAWVKQCAPPPKRCETINLNFVAPYVRALLAQDTEESREEAGEILADRVADADLVRFNEPRIQFRILQALWHQQRGSESDTLQVLGEAVRIAQPGGALRIFADFGEEILPLLHRLDLDTEGVEYLGRIMQAMAPPSEEGGETKVLKNPIPAPGSLGETLSKREFEVLLHLSKRLSNNEIGEALFISPVTVKRHLSNIYEKLAVHGRKAAIAKAVGLGLLKG
jgi:ATP/maltotriose-dependent transcriptional regulator MalT